MKYKITKFNDRYWVHTIRNGQWKPFKNLDFSTEENADNWVKSLGSNIMKLDVDFSIIRYMDTDTHKYRVFRYDGLYHIETKYMKKLCFRKKYKLIWNEIDYKYFPKDRKFYQGYSAEACYNTDCGFHDINDANKIITNFEKIRLEEKKLNKIREIK
jgi:hypothetical protein